jgi:hypothetical protein
MKLYLCSLGVAMTTWSRAVPVGLLVVLVSGGCLKKGADELPSEPNPPESPAAAPSLTPIAPVPVGPAPPSTPTGGPTPEPGATPAPPTASACRLPRGTGTGEGCPRQSPAFLGDVQAAIKQLIQEQPDIFVKRACEDCYDVTDPGAFISGVIQQLGRRGFCAMHDGEELAIKNSNDFNEQYDILSSSNGVRSGGESYRSTCRPAWF